MKALTIKQPWASLIIDGHKDIENRDWYTSVRGRVAIHSSKTSTDDDYESAMAVMSMLGKPFPECSLANIPMGMILGTVEIVDCVKDSNSPWFFGRYGFVLRDPIKLAQPIPIKGALGFWDVPHHIAETLLASPGIR